MRGVAAALALASPAGCWTLADTFDDRPRCGVHPYCGTATDVRVLQAVGEEHAGIVLALAPLALIDLPFSLVADTLFLPCTAFHTDSEHD